MLSDNIDLRPPTFSFILSRAFHWFGQNKIWSYRLIFILVGVCLNICCYIVARTASGRWGALAALIALNTTVVFVFTLIHVRQDGLLVLSLLISFAFIYSWQQTGKDYYSFGAGFFGGLAFIIKLTPFPIVIVSGLRILFQDASNKVSFKFENRKSFFAYTGGVIFTLFFLLNLYPWDPVNGLINISFMFFEVVLLFQLLSVKMNSTIAYFLKHEMFFFFLIAISALLILFSPRDIKNADLKKLIAISMFSYLPMLFVKKSVHIQDVLVVAVLGSISIEPAHKLKIDQNKLQNCRSNILNLVNVL